MPMNREQTEYYIGLAWAADMDIAECSNDLDYKTIGAMFNVFLSLDKSLYGNLRIADYGRKDFFTVCNRLDRRSK